MKRRRCVWIAVALAGLLTAGIATALGVVLVRRNRPWKAFNAGLETHEPYFLEFQENGGALTIDLPQRSPIELQLWSVDTGECRVKRGFPDYRGQFIDWCGQNDLILNNSLSCIRAVSLTTGNVVGGFDRNDEQHVGVGFVTRSDLIAASFHDRIELVRLDGSVVQTLRFPGYETKDGFISFSASASYVTAHGFVWSTRDGKLIARLPENASVVGDTRSGALVLVTKVNDESVLGVYSIPSFRLLHEIARDPQLSASLSDSGDRVVIRRPSRIDVYSVDTAEVLRRIPFSPPKTENDDGERWPLITISFAGDRVALGFPGGRVEVWEIPP